MLSYRGGDLLPVPSIYITEGQLACIGLEWHFGADISVAISSESKILRQNV